MNPLLSAALTSLARWALTLAAGYFIRAGVWEEAEAKTYVAALAVAIVTLLWSLWSRYRSRIKFLTALSMPRGSTEHDVRQCVAQGLVPPVTTPPHEPPVPKESIQ